ncbi:DUF4124 domain-containing protein [Rheinheimera salexigens]|uniref:DUF4124 domain-containing protein n=1 Tax=Rheinheimera salexigens TaxID=1628148 RepID=A0A1E7Q8B0_9GAMM|nr:DUF4124 domain-containing protein [Rheinheimera salexigens]OEY70331.1 hypothetical protein BI198_12690 [Rheinheimera salexigens]
MKYRLLLLTLIFIASSNVHANVYKCEVDGVVTFSQSPCADDAEITDYSRENADPVLNNSQPVAGINSSAIGETPEQTFERIALANNKRDLMSRINWKKREVKKVINERNAKIASVRNQKGKVQLNVAGVLYEDSLSNDIMAITSQYDVTINELNREIDQMMAEHQKL